MMTEKKENKNFKSGIGRKQHIISIIFLLYFFFYAVTPLLFSCTINSFENSYLRNPKYNIDKFHLYILDAICSQISNHTNFQKKDSHTIYIILKKKRAVLPDDDYEKSLKPAHYAVISLDRFFSKPHEIVSFHYIINTGRPKSFRLTFSGLSPPSA